MNFQIPSFPVPGKPGRTITKDVKDLSTKFDAQLLNKEVKSSASVLSAHTKEARFRYFIGNP